MTPPRLVVRLFAVYVLVVFALVLSAKLYCLWP